MTHPTVHRGICGTEKGYREHRKRGEERCQPCKTAWNKRCKQYQPERVSRSENVISEIEFMLSLNQGFGYIIQAIGYSGREKSLERYLQRHGRGDLATILDGEKLAA